jgi:hypothetical protein
MVEIRGSRWTPQEDALLRTMAEANVRPEREPIERATEIAK